GDFKHLGMSSRRDRVSRPGCFSSALLGGLGTQDGPAWVGIAGCPALPVVERKTQHPASPGIVLRRPRREGVFHPSGVVALSGVRVRAVRAPVPELLGFGQSHTWWLPFTRSFLTLDPNRLRAVEQ